MSATCRSCKAAIVWAETVNGKSMPVNAEPAQNGNIDLEPNSDPREPPIAHMLDATGSRNVHGARQSPFLRYTSHFATCPQAIAFRHGTVRS